MQHDGSEVQLVPDRDVDPVDRPLAGATRATLAALPRRAPQRIGRKPPVGLARTPHPAAGAGHGEPSLFSRTPATSPPSPPPSLGSRPSVASPGSAATAAAAARPPEPGSRRGVLRRVGLRPRALALAVAFVALATLAGFVLGTLVDRGHRTRAEVALFGVDDARARRSEVQLARSDEVLRVAAERTGFTLDAVRRHVAIAARPGIGADELTAGSPTGVPSAVLVIDVDGQNDTTAVELAAAVSSSYVDATTARVEQVARDRVQQALVEARRRLAEADAAYREADDELRRRLTAAPLEQRLDISNAAVEALRVEVERITGELSGLQAELDAPTLGADQIRVTPAGPPLVQEGSGTMTPARSAAIALLAAIVLAGLILTVASTRDEKGPHSG